MMHQPSLMIVVSFGRQLFLALCRRHQLRQFRQSRLLWEQWMKYKQRQMQQQKMQGIHVRAQAQEQLQQLILLQEPHKKEQGGAEAGEEAAAEEEAAEEAAGSEAAAQEETEEETTEAEEAEGLLFHPLVPSKPEHQALFEI